MPSKTKKQQSFFRAVQHAKHNPDYGDEHLRKVASSMSDTDIEHFTKLAEVDLKLKKAVLSTLKEIREEVGIREPMYLQEEDEENQSIDPVASEFHKNENWAKYIKPYVGQPFSSKELEAVGNFEDKQSLTIKRTEIWCKSKDDMGISHATVIRKMKDSGQFSYTAFQKQERPTPDQGQDQNQGMNAGAEPSPLPDLGGNPLGGLGGPPEAPTGETPPGAANPPPEGPSPEQKQKQKDQEAGKEDIIVTKSILFKDDIKGASILIEFLKKLDL